MSALPLHEHEPMVPLEAFRAAERLHEIEVAKQRMLLVKYRVLLEEHGIEAPDEEGQDLLDMWRDCQAVIQTAFEFVMRLGTSKELLQRWT